MSHLHFYYLLSPLENCTHDPRKRWWQLFAVRSLRVVRTDGWLQSENRTRHWVYTPWGAFFIEAQP